MSDIDYSLSGGNTQTIPGVSLSAVTDAMAELAARPAFIEAPGRDGETPLNTPPTYESRDIELTYAVQGSSASEIRDSVARLQSALLDTRTITRTWAGATTTATVRLRRVAKPTMFEPQALISVSATFALPGVFWSAAPVTITPIVPNSQTGASFDSTVAGMAGAISDLTVTAAGPLTYLRVADRTSGTWVDWTGTVPAGQTLTLDTGAAKATVNGANLPGGISMHPNGGRVIPSGGAAKLTVTRAGGTGTVTVKYSPPFL